jgi:hypothetical protein
VGGGWSTCVAARKEGGRQPACLLDGRSRERPQWRLRRLGEGGSCGQTRRKRSCRQHAWAQERATSCPPADPAAAPPDNRLRWRRRRRRLLSAPAAGPSVGQLLQTQPLLRAARGQRLLQAALRQQHHVAVARYLIQVKLL